MKTENDRFSLEENLVLTNEELTSNWAKFASFIRSYENISWDEAAEKARLLLKEKAAIPYIEAVRIMVRDGKASGEPAAQPKPAPAKKKLANEKTIYEKNYDKLMAIAPGLEERLAQANKNGDYLYGKSVRTGYMDFNIELLLHDKTGYYIAISHYYVQNGDMVPDPDMEILVNLDKRTVEALHFQNAYKYVEVYDDKYDRDLVNTKEKRAQNDFLGQWLKNLKSQGHKIAWKEEESTGVPKSVIVDQYQKADRPASKPQKPEETKKVEEPKPEKEPEPRPEPIVEPETKTEKEPELAKIIPLPGQPTEQERKEVLDAFIRIVRVTDKLTGLRIVYKIKEILETQGTSQYLLSAWDKMMQSDYGHLIELNYLRLHLLVPDFLETLRQEKGVIRLESQQSKTVFRMQIGDDSKEGVVVGIVQQTGKTPEPSLLINVNGNSQTITTELSTNSFAGAPDYYPDKKDEHSLGQYESAIAFERWLKYLDLKGFKPVLVHMRKTDDAKPSKEPESAPEPQAENDPHSNNYINKDIPDFEPGKVKLTEAHKKRGVTQKVINHINRTKEGVTLYPRAKRMVPATKSVKADAKIQAKQPGFRLSATGKFYYEGRSNRADRTTDKGL